MTSIESSNSEEPVLVAVHRIEYELLRDVQEACSKAHARYVPWAGEVGLPSLRKTPTVLVTGLRVGERRIPDDVLDLATNAYPDLSVLVLCREPLLRPTMSLNNGRITLVSPPLTSPRVASALRGLLSDRHVGYASTDTAPGLVGGKAPVAVRRYRRADCSVGVLASGVADGGGAPRLPVVRHTRTEGLTVLLPRPGIVVEPLFDQVTASFRHDKTEAERGASLQDVLGDQAGALHLSPSADEWAIYWPLAQWPLLLASPLRLPNVWNMSRTLERIGKTFMLFPAAHCDMFAALTGYPSFGSVPEEKASDGKASSDRTDSVMLSASGLMPALSEGGAAFLEFLERSLRDRPAEFHAAIVEVF